MILKLQHQANLSIHNTTPNATPTITVAFTGDCYGNFSICTICERVAVSSVVSLGGVLAPSYHQKHDCKENWKSLIGIQAIRLARTAGDS
jgi:hypothetical protein